MGLRGGIEARAGAACATQGSAPLPLPCLSAVSLANRLFFQRLFVVEKLSHDMRCPLIVVGPTPPFWRESPRGGGGFICPKCPWPQRRQRQLSLWSHWSCSGKVGFGFGFGLGPLRIFGDCPPPGGGGGGLLDDMHPTF